MSKTLVEETMRSMKSVWLLALVVAGCSDPVGSTNIVGRWGQDFSIPGNVFEMDLTLSGSIVSGAGNWCGEAGPCGTVTVTGTITEDAVELDMTYSPQVPIPGPMSTQHFSGRLASRDSLQGTVGVGTPGPIQSISYHRV